jgi:hypothetical protein
MKLIAVILFFALSLSVLVPYPEAIQLPRNLTQDTGSHKPAGTVNLKVADEKPEDISSSVAAYSKTEAEKKIKFCIESGINFHICVTYALLAPLSFSFLRMLGNLPKRSDVGATGTFQTYRRADEARLLKIREEKNRVEMEVHDFEADLKQMRPELEKLLQERANLNKNPTKNAEKLAAINIQINTLNAEIRGRELRVNHYKITNNAIIKKIKELEELEKERNKHLETLENIYPHRKNDKKFADKIKVFREKGDASAIFDWIHEVSPEPSKPTKAEIFLKTDAGREWLSKMERLNADVGGKLTDVSDLFNTVIDKHNETDRREKLHSTVLPMPGPRGYFRPNELVILPPNDFKSPPIPLARENWISHHQSICLDYFKALASEESLIVKRLKRTSPFLESRFWGGTTLAFAAAFLGSSYFIPEEARKSAAAAVDSSKTAAGVKLNTKLDIGTQIANERLKTEKENRLYPFFDTILKALEGQQDEIIAHLDSEVEALKSQGLEEKAQELKKRIHILKSDKKELLNFIEVALATESKTLPPSLDTILENYVYAKSSAALETQKNFLAGVYKRLFTELFKTSLSANRIDKIDSLYSLKLVLSTQGKLKEVSVIKEDASKPLPAPGVPTDTKDSKLGKTESTGAYLPPKKETAKPDGLVDMARGLNN